MTRKRSTTERGYGTAHQAARRRWAKVIAGGRGFCARCGKPIAPGDPWDLGHDDSVPGKRAYLGPECVDCNRSAGAKKGNAMRRARRAIGEVTRLRW